MSAVTPSRIHHRFVAGFAACVAAAAGLFASVPALAADWEFVIRADAYVAISRLDGRSIAFACSPSGATLSFTTMKRAVEGAYEAGGEAYLIVDFADVDGGYHLSIPTTLVERQADVLLAIEGDDAIALARRIERAKDGVFFGVSLEPKDKAFFEEDHFSVFRISGAAEAIGQAFAACSGQVPPADVAAEAGTAPVAETTDWIYSAESRKASVEEDGHRVVAICGSRGLVIFYAVPRDEIADELVNLERAYVIFTIDERDNGSGRYLSVNSNFVPQDGELTIGLGGELAARLARDFSRAGRNIVVGISPDEPDDSYYKYNTIKFSAKGSTAAIKALLADCNG